MKLLLALCLTGALLIHTAESLLCHMCSNEDCSNTTSVSCPTFSFCRTATTLRQTGSSMSVSVNKSCSTSLSCFTALNTVSEFSVNQGFIKEASRQLCCATDNCNSQTLDIPNNSTNGKTCPGCANITESLDGSCNSTLSCEGVEDRCFRGTVTLNSTQSLILGCISNNICTVQSIFGFLLSENIQITCGAPCSVRMSAMLLTLAVSAHKILF